MGAVEFGGRGFWAYDVSLSLLLVEAIRAGEELPADRRPAGLPGVLDQLRVVAVVPDLGFPIEESWPPREVDLLRSLLIDVSRRLAVRGTVAADGVATWDVLDGGTISLRGAEVVDLTPVIELAGATVQLVEGTLPRAPAGTWWAYGFEGGRRTIAMRS
ncbi:hypothetical protein [Rugosimonospora acidiphila]